MSKRLRGLWPERWRSMQFESRFKWRTRALKCRRRTSASSPRAESDSLLMLKFFGKDLAARQVRVALNQIVWGSKS